MWTIKHFVTTLIAWWTVLTDTNEVIHVTHKRSVGRPTVVSRNHGSRQTVTMNLVSITWSHMWSIRRP